MCYSGMCPYERGALGTCRGPRDYNQPDAPCNPLYDDYDPVADEEVNSDDAEADAV
jgi:hypothetical protein